MQVSMGQTAPEYYNVSFLSLSQPAPLLTLWSCTQLQLKSPNKHHWCNSLMHSREGSSWKLLKLRTLPKKGFSTEKIVCCICMTCLLFLLEKPSKPKCWLEGELLEGKELSLQCHSASGTAPISYRWQRINEEDERAEHLPPTSRVSKSGHFLLELSVRSKPDNRPRAHAHVQSSACFLNGNHLMAVIVTIYQYLSLLQLDVVLCSTLNKELPEEFV